MRPTLAEGAEGVKHMFEFPLDSERVFGQGSCMRRTYVRRRIFAASAAALLLWSVPAAARAIGPSAESSVAPRRYVVQQGDTLWEIAVDAAPQQDPREVVDAIATANEIRAGLVPGQEITLPPFD
jgi:hypothetical protein